MFIWLIEIVESELTDEYLSFRSLAKRRLYSDCFLNLFVVPLLAPRMECHRCSLGLTASNTPLLLDLFQVL